MKQIKCSISNYFLHFFPPDFTRLFRVFIFTHFSFVKADYIFCRSLSDELPMFQQNSLIAHTQNLWCGMGYEQDGNALVKHILHSLLAFFAEFSISYTQDLI